MIYVDPRAGSGPVAALLTKRHLPVTTKTMRFADFRWYGNGPNDSRLKVGVEYKKLPELLSSITGERRFITHQLPGLMRTHRRVGLLIEGVWMPDADGSILILKESFEDRHGVQHYTFRPSHAPVTFQHLEAFLMTLHTQAGVYVHVTPNLAGTVRWLHHAYAWWQKKWTAHRSHLSLPDGDITLARRDGLFSKRTIARRMIYQVPGIGWERSKWIAAKFGTMENILNASQKDMTGVPKVGKVFAERVYRALRSAS